MMSDYDRTMELIDAAYNSAGKSQQQFAKNMETIEFKTKRLKNSWETLRQSFVNSDFFKGAADSANNLLQSLNELSGKDYAVLAASFLLFGKNLAMGIIKGFSQSITSINAAIGTTIEKISQKIIPENLKITNNIEGLLLNAAYLVLSIPSQYLRSIIAKVSNQIKSDMVIVNTAKGLEIASHERLTDVIKDELLGKYHKNLVVLSGPTHAEEVAKKIPSAIVAASSNKDVAKRYGEDNFHHTLGNLLLQSNVVWPEKCRGNISTCHGNPLSRYDP